MLNDLYQMLDPVAFAIGPFSARWYGLAYVAGFCLGALVLYFTAKRWKVRFDEDSIANIMLCVIFGVIIGARLGFCLFYGQGYYFQHPLHILFVQEGGMSFHGGLIGALLGGIVAGRVTKIPYLTLTDMGVVSAPIGLFFGRCANFVNGELWGAPTDAPWGVVFGGSAGMMARHPSQLYEACLEGVILFIILFALSRMKNVKPQGFYTGFFLAYYGCVRFLIEFVRQPDSYMGYLLGTDWLTMGQVLSVPLVVAGVALIAYSCIAKRPQQGLPEPSE